MSTTIEPTAEEQALLDEISVQAAEIAKLRDALENIAVQPMANDWSRTIAKTALQP